MIVWIAVYLSSVFVPADGSLERGHENLGDSRVARWRRIVAAGAQGQEADAESKIIALERVAKLQACEAKDLRTLDAMLDDYSHT